ncbi:MAG: cupin domain-containing protein [Erysipelotrichaceae bacterium]|nr:cupin domain-containing protein [Erysipelotrichaceae bacterium]
MVKHESCTVVSNLGGGKGDAKMYHFVPKEDLHDAGRFFGKVVLEPGCSVGWHKHSGETEPYYILKGEGTFIDNDGSKTLVHPGDICTIEDNQYHSIENNSNEPLEFIGLIYNL